MFTKSKKLGQYFLKPKYGWVIETIIKAAEIEKNDTVLEIGPGKGILTRALAKKAAKVIAVEKDENLAAKLKSETNSNLEIIAADIRDALKNDSFRKKLGADYKVLGNIPYYLTSHILKMLLEECPKQPKTIVFMIQKEVGERITAKPPRANILGLSVQVYADPKIIAKIPKNYFQPEPKVASCVIAIKNISKVFFRRRNLKEKRFFALIKIGFSHKRKLLANNLSRSKIMNIGQERLLNAFKACGINQKSRAENCSLQNWSCLYKELAFYPHFRRT